MAPDAMIFWMLSFKPIFSLPSFTLLKRLFSSSSLAAIKVVSSTFLRLLIFVPANLIPACNSSRPALFSTSSKTLPLRFNLALVPRGQVFGITRSGTVGSYDILMCNHLRNCQTFLQQSYHFIFPSAIYESSNFFISSATCYYAFLIKAILVFVKQYLTIVLNAFPWWLMMLSIFLQAYWTLVDTVWRNVYSDLCSFFKLGYLSFIEL